MNTTASDATTGTPSDADTNPAEQTPPPRSDTTDPVVGAMPDPTRAIPKQGELGRGWFIALGVLLVLTGAGALVFPLAVALSVNLLVGITLLIGGVLTLAHAFRAKGWKGRALTALLGLLYVAGGLFFLADPLAGMFTLAIMLGAFFAADGVARLMLALRLRPEGAWWLFLASGLLSLLIGVMLFFGMATGLSIAFLGILVGVNLIFAGVSYVCCRGVDGDRETAAA
ncbi:HdeD family acid-resistance protein [Erythrobacter sp.]|uniref:HdeD family acid-resistance protein n=1 Tax=Erythrobacter sp. TaxID=1042 RepID=UPI001426005C|nr:HdeD family acid-resistance protein [Erythrobacter sp.]QIQ85659.1 MAG: HdeD family acid-resistance protein [Erythrobacter sp.]